MKRLLLISCLMLLVVSSVSASNQLDEYELKYSNDFSEMPNHSISENQQTRWHQHNHSMISIDYDNKQSGDLNLVLDDYYLNSNYTYSLQVTKDFANCVDMVGLLWGSAKNNTEYYVFMMNPAQVGISRRTVDATYSYYHSMGLKLIPDEITLGNNKLQVNVYDDYSDFFIDDVFLTRLNIPAIEGYIGLYSWDSSGKNDPETEAKATYKNLLVYSTPNISIETSYNDESLITSIVNVSSETNITSIETNIEQVDIYQNGTESVKLLYSNTTEIDNKTAFSINETIDTSDIIVETKSESTIVRLFYVVKDFLGNLFKSEYMEI